MRLKFSPRGARHPIKVVGIRPGEKLHEVLVNEYEMQRITELPNYYAIHPEYRVPKRLTPKPLGTEYTSANTRRLERSEDIHALLDAMGEVESYI
jgi:FlaA1/EpsC-like NDP-sugar epimerase